MSFPPQLAIQSLLCLVPLGEPSYTIGVMGNDVSLLCSWFMNREHLVALGLAGNAMLLGMRCRRGTLFHVEGVGSCNLVA